MVAFYNYHSSVYWLCEKPQKRNDDFHTLSLEERKVASGVWEDKKQNSLL
jgi:hypothetical protein